MHDISPGPVQVGQRAGDAPECGDFTSRITATLARFRGPLASARPGLSLRLRAPPVKGEEKLSRYVTQELGLAGWEVTRDTDLSFKIPLTVQEKIGQIGMQEIPELFLNDVMWAFSLDRKRAFDVIVEYGGKATCCLEQQDRLV